MSSDNKDLLFKSKGEGLKNKITIYDLLNFEEGFSEKPFLCSNGWPTIGSGHVIGPKGADISLYKFTMSRRMSDLWMQEEVESIVQKLALRQWFVDLPSDKQTIVVSMSYQMGVSGILKFADMIVAFSTAREDDDQKEALDSIWARKDSPNRAKRHARVLGGEPLKSVYAGLID